MRQTKPEHHGDARARGAAILPEVGRPCHDTVAKSLERAGVPGPARGERGGIGFPRASGWRRPSRRYPNACGVCRPQTPPADAAARMTGRSGAGRRRRAMGAPKAAVLVFPGLGERHTAKDHGRDGSWGLAFVATPRPHLASHDKAPPDIGGHQSQNSDYRYRTFDIIRGALTSARASHCPASPSTDRHPWCPGRLKLCRRVAA